MQDGKILGGKITKNQDFNIGIQREKIIEKLYILWLCLPFVRKSGQSHYIAPLADVH